jgi:hypothetical protein
LVAEEFIFVSLSHSGKYLTIPRTEGVSTTDIVGRMLLMTRSHHAAVDADKAAEFQLVKSAATDKGRSNFLTTSRIIRLFGAGVQVENCSLLMIYYNKVTFVSLDYRPRLRIPRLYTWRGRGTCFMPDMQPSWKGLGSKSKLGVSSLFDLSCCR